MKQISLVTLAGLLLMFSAFGCNTYRGAGKDLSDAGDKMQDVGK